MLKLSNISKYYHANEVVAQGLRKVSAEFKIGEFIAITGESGSGKTTLLNVISGLDTYEDGELFVNEEETSYYSVEDWENYRRQYIGFVFQNYNIIDSYSVLENIMIALQIQGYDKETRKSRALELIDRVGLTSHINHKASKLSGGQKQRAVIARALAKDCPIIVADEPTGNLDSVSAKQIMLLLKEISKDKLVIVVSHNYDELADIATRKIRMFDGEIVEDTIIKSTEKEVTIKELSIYKMTFKDMFKISFKNLIRTPKRTIFQIFTALFIALVFFLSYGAYVSATSTPNYTYTGGLIGNPFEQRITVIKSDETPFTESNIIELENIKNVNMVVKDDVFFDMRPIALNYDTQFGTYIGIMTNTQVYPLEAINNTVLLEGRLPENETEIVIARNDMYKLGDTIKLSMGGRVIYGGSGGITADLVFDYKIVGITQVFGYQYNIDIYFHPDFFKTDIAKKYAYNSIERGTYRFNLKYISDDGLTNFDFSDIHMSNVIIDNDLADFEIIMNEDKVLHIANTIPGIMEMENIIDTDWKSTLPFYIEKATNYGNQLYRILISEEEHSDNFYNVKMNQDTYDDIFFSEESRQAAVIVDNLVLGKMVSNELEELGYRVVYPSNVQTADNAITSVLNKVLLGTLMTALLFVVYFISYLVLKNIQTAKKNSYLILRSIGASKNNLYKISIIELILIMITGFIIALLLLIINEHIKTFIPDYLSFFNFGSFITILILLIILGWALANRFNKRIFNRSVITSLKEE